MAKTKASDSRTPAEKFHTQVLKNLKKAVDSDEHNRSAGLEDLRFANGDQWDNAEKNRRSLSGRPVIKTNLLPKFIQQMVGEQRLNRPKIKVIPVDSKADVHLARIREGIIRTIEYNSNAPQIYDQAFESAITCGYGAWRVLTRYTEEDPFLQEIYMESIKNPFLVYMDPSSKDRNYSDAKWGFVLQKMPKEDFELQYPDAELPGDNLKVGKGLGSELWYDKDSVTVAEYFVAETEKQVICLMDNGETYPEDKAKEKIKEWREKAAKIASAMQSHIELSDKKLQNPGPLPPQVNNPQMGNPSIAPGGGPILPGSKPPQPQGPQPQGPQPQGPQPAKIEEFNEPEPKIIRKRETEITRIKQYILTGVEVIDGPNDVPGKYIPIVLLKGMERNIEGKNYVRGVVRDAKDSQKMINYWQTVAFETIALTPKTPWIGTAKQFAGYEQDYATANSDNIPFLKYNIDEGAPPPSRLPVAQPPLALFEQIRRAEDNLRNILGMNTPDMAEQGPERTGAAVLNKRSVSDTANYSYYDNLNQAVAFAGKIIIEMIPEVYDTERDIRLRNIDESEVFLPVNSIASDAVRRMRRFPDRYVGVDLNFVQHYVNKNGDDAKFNDLTVGKYDVQVSTGPSYSTQRQEAATMLMQLTQAMPQQMALGADIMVRNMDFPGASELSERLKRQLPPGLVKPEAGKPAPPPLPPPPAVQVQQAKIQVEQMKQQSAQMKAKNEQSKLAFEQEKIQYERLKLQNEMAKHGQDMKLGEMKLQNEAAAGQRGAQIDQLKLKQQVMEIITELLGGQGGSETGQMPLM